MLNRSLGDQELDLLRYLSEAGASTVGEAVDGYGSPRGLSRSTVVTVMERLRKKGYLVRDKLDGTFHYRCSVEKNEIEGSLIQRFIDKTMAGSLLPFAAYFSRSERLTDAERAELEALISKLEGATDHMKDVEEQESEQ